MKLSFDYIKSTHSKVNTQRIEGENTHIRLKNQLQSCIEIIIIFLHIHKLTLIQSKKYCEISRVVIYIIYNRLLIGDAQSELQTQV